MELHKMRGGAKTLWIKNHRETILDFYSEFGAEETTEQFNLCPETLTKLIAEQSSFKPNRKLTETQRALIQSQVAEEAVYQLRREVAELKQLFEAFQDDVGKQLIEKFFRPLLQAGLATGKEGEQAPPQFISKTPSVADIRRQIENHQNAKKSRENQ